MAGDKTIPIALESGIVVGSVKIGEAGDIVGIIEGTNAEWAQAALRDDDVEALTVSLKKD